MPKSHRDYGKWNSGRLMTWAAKVGEQTLQWVETALESVEHPPQAYRRCLGLLRLYQSYPARLEAACGVANKKGLTRLRQVKELLKNNMDKLPLLGE